MTLKIIRSKIGILNVRRCKSSVPNVTKLGIILLLYIFNNSFCSFFSSIIFSLYISPSIKSNIFLISSKEILKNSLFVFILYLNNNL